MNYIKLFEEFNPKEIVTVDGEIGQVIAERGNKVMVQFFKPKRTEKLDKSKVKSNIKCLSQCDKKIVGSGNNRFIKCTYCGKEQKFKRK